MIIDSVRSAQYNRIHVQNLPNVHGMPRLGRTPPWFVEGLECRPADTGAAPCRAGWSPWTLMIPWRWQHWGWFDDDSINMDDLHYLFILFYIDSIICISNILQYFLWFDDSGSDWAWHDWNILEIFTIASIFEAYVKGTPEVSWILTSDGKYSKVDDRCWQSLHFS